VVCSSWVWGFATSGELQLKIPTNVYIYIERTLIIERQTLDKGFGQEIPRYARTFQRLSCCRRRERSATLSITNTRVPLDGKVPGDLGCRHCRVAPHANCMDAYGTAVLKRICVVVAGSQEPLYNTTPIYEIPG
jgi:hypothetical protein